MTGWDFRDQQNAQVLFNVLFENSVDHWLWFMLKLASVDLDLDTNSKNNKAEFDSEILRAQQADDLSLVYRCFYLEDLVDEIANQRKQEDFYEPHLTDKENKATYARILFNIGEFKYGLDCLLESEFQVEATIMAVALSQLNLLSTKENLFKIMADKDDHEL